MWWWIAYGTTQVCYWCTYLEIYTVSHNMIFGTTTKFWKGKPDFTCQLSFGLWGENPETATLLHSWMLLILGYFPARTSGRDNGTCSWNISVSWAPEQECLFRALCQVCADLETFESPTSELQCGGSNSCDCMYVCVYVCVPTCIKQSSLLSS